MNAKPTDASGPIAVLRQFARPRSANVERCELCSTVLGSEHPHLLELGKRRIVCACDPCAILFPGRQNAKFRRIPRMAQLLPDFRLADEIWETLLIPIKLAFFFRHEEKDRIVAFYPSPAGATESLLPLETWQYLVEENPILNEFEPDVEALLVNRVGAVGEYYRVGIDVCYKLAGLIRSQWRGLSGGTEVWEEIHRFFQSLKEQGGFAEGNTHA